MDSLGGLRWVALIALGLVACGDEGGKGKKGGSGSASPSASAVARVSGSNAPRSGGAPVTDDKGRSGGEGEYEKLVLALSTCAAKEDANTYYGYLDSACPALKALNEWRGVPDNNKKIGDTSALGVKLISNESAAIRLYAAQMMESLFGTKPEALKALLAQVKVEKDPAVLKAILHASANNGGRNAEIGAMLLELANHANPNVRATAAVSISSSWNKDMKGAPEKLAEMMEKDADMSVRKAACAYAGHLGAASLVPVYERLTDPKADQELAAECMRGVLDMWASYPLWDRQDEAAYKLTLKRLDQTPRTEKFPPWTMMGTLQNVGEGKGESFDKWKAGAKWMDPAVLRRSLAGVLLDKKANWMARTGAVKAAIALGAAKADLEDWKKKLDAKDTNDKYVIDAIDKDGAKAK